MKRARTSSASAFFDGSSESTDYIARNVLTNFIPRNTLIQQDLIEALMNDYPHLSVYASDDRPNLGGLGHMEYHNTAPRNGSTLRKLADGYDAMKRRLDDSWNWQNLSAVTTDGSNFLSCTQNSPLILKSAYLKQYKKGLTVIDGSTFMWISQLADYQGIYTTDSTTDSVVRTFSSLQGEMKQSTINFTGTFDKIGTYTNASKWWHNLSQGKNTYDPLVTQGCKVSGDISDIKDNKFTWYFYVPMKIDMSKYQGRISYYRNISVTIPSGNPTVTFTYSDSDLNPRGVLLDDLFGTQGATYRQLFYDSAGVPSVNTLTNSFTASICSADEMTQIPPYIAEVQDGTHTLKTYVWIPCKLQTSNLISSSFKIDNITGLITGTAFQQFTPSQTMKVYIDETWRQFTSSDDPPQFRWLEGSGIPLPAGQYTITLPPIDISCQVFQPTTGLATQLVFVIPFKDIASHLATLETKVQGLQTQTEYLIKMVNFLTETVSSLDKRLSSLQAKALDQRGIPGLGGNDKKLIAQAGLALSLADLVVNVMGLTPVVGDVIKDARDILQSINEVYKNAYNVIDQFTDTASMVTDLFYAIHNFKNLQDIIPLMNALTSKQTGKSFMDGQQEIIAKEILAKMQSMIDQMQMVSQNYEKITFEELENKFEYVITPLSQIGPSGNKFYEALMNLNIPQILYEEISLLPVHAFCIAKIVKTVPGSGGTVNLVSDNFIISVGDFQHIPTLALPLQALGILGNNKSLMGYHHYTSTYDLSQRKWVYDDATDGQKVQAFYTASYGEKKTQVVGQYPITIEADQLTSYLELHKKYAPTYNLLAHNCQVQSKQIIGFSYTTYRPPWWNVDVEREYIDGYALNKAWGSNWASWKSNVIQDEVNNPTQS